MSGKQQSNFVFLTNVLLLYIPNQEQLNYVYNMYVYIIVRIFTCHFVCQIAKQIAANGPIATRMAKAAIDGGLQVWLYILFYIVRK